MRSRGRANSLSFANSDELYFAGIWRCCSVAPNMRSSTLIQIFGIRACAREPADGNEHPILRSSRVRAREEADGNVVVSFYMIRRRAIAAGTHAPIGNHSFRATGITAYLANDGTLEHAQEMAAHESPRTTKLYDRTQDRLTQKEVERIRL
jgi:integrase